MDCPAYWRSSTTSRTGLRRQPGQERGHRLERPAPLHLRAAVPGRRGPEQRRSLGQQRRECRYVLSEQLPQGAGRHPGDERCDRFRDRLQEQRSLGLIAARAQHRRAIAVRICREILRQGRLADPGLPDDHDQAGTAGHGAVQASRSDPASPSRPASTRLRRSGRTNDQAGPNDLDGPNGPRAAVPIRPGHDPAGARIARWSSLCLRRGSAPSSSASLSRSAS